MKQIVFFISFWLTVAEVNAQEFEVFYLSIGNANYESREEKFEGKYAPFSPVSGARRSARYVAELLERRSNGQGNMLRSDGNHLLSKVKILAAVNDLINTVKKSKAKNPLVVFYYCGHGVSEGIAWSQFLVPGDFTEKPDYLDTDPLAIDLNELSDKLLYVGEITDLFAEAELPYFCLIDACYEGVEEDFSALDPWFTQTAAQNFKDVAAVLRFMNEYHQENPVLFATQPGMTTKTVTDPSLPEGVKIGPLCRKMLLIEKQLDITNPLTLMDVVMLLHDPGFDELTKTATGNYEMGENAFTPFLIKQD
ncbi:caspase family protein [Algoriphagus sp. D3-2-R+10]|uniref:hypothetical protein n=1 Tax=Algoriphagus aurantiacus TaxID=3103948 RepID=UPI002B3D45C8|nr:hypothetical protein [Algoriphagus sp. D3-2-R+10]MEB2777470.1 caspase family protein [Algoriphagus sp. D3-2-R+10]